MVITTYSGQNIKRLEGLEAVLGPPGMYLGNKGVYYLHRILMEPIDNAVDEILSQLTPDLESGASAGGSPVDQPT